MDGAGEVARLLATIGGPDYRDALARFLSLDEQACAALLAVVSGDRPTPPAGVPDAHPRDVMEYALEIVDAAARQWPQRFEAVVAASPVLRRHVTAINALRELSTAGSEAMLVEAAQVREAGNGYLRATAVESLLARRSRSLTDLLPRLLGDRHDAARRAALEAARRYGDERSLRALHRIADNPRRGPWERDKASGAIAKIKRRTPPTSLAAERSGAVPRGRNGPHHHGPESRT